MNEMKRLMVVLGSLLAVIVLMFIVTMAGGKEQEKLYNEFKEAMAGEKNTLVYVGRPTCGYCNLLTPSLNEMAERYGFDYIYLNTDELNSNYISKMMEDLKLTKVSTPYLAVVSNNKIVDTQGGYVDYDELFEFLQDNGIISEDAELLLNYIGLEEYNELLANDDKSIIVVGQSTCSYCIQSKLILNEIAEETGLEINYLNLSYLTQEEGEKFESSLEYFEGEWGTPILFIGQNGKMVDIIDQLVTKEKYIEFLEENDILNTKEGE